jgi:hypothetical protein
VRQQRHGLKRPSAEACLSCGKSSKAHVPKTGIPAVRVRLSQTALPSHHIVGISGAQYSFGWVAVASDALRMPPHHWC